MQDQKQIKKMKMESNPKNDDLKMAIAVFSFLIILFAMAFLFLIKNKQQNIANQNTIVKASQTIEQNADSIDYTCPHCGYNVKLTLKNK